MLEIYTDKYHRIMYATDASAYREIPKAVAFPENKQDIKILIKKAQNEKTSIIPRGAGTSLAGQVVGKGIIVDISKKMTKILKVNEKEKWVKLQPGVILTKLNKHLEPYKLFFGPETSTANRVTIGGMVGNNACGLHSVAYGSTRDHIAEVKAILSDGSDVTFKNITKKEFQEKIKLKNLEGKIYRKLYKILSNKQNQKLIQQKYPHKKLKRRNTGYALDIIADTEIFTNSNKKLNIAKLIAGSEGTLAFIYEIKLNLSPIPPPEKAVICIHLHKLQHAFFANLIALKYKPSAVELIDKKILDLTKNNKLQNENRSFLKKDPEAILIVELNDKNKKNIIEKANKMEKEMKKNNYGFHFPIIWNNETKKIWELRKAGLGVLANIPGDTKPVSLVEDTAVDVNKLPEYINEFDQIMKKYKLSCVYHAHIGTGELHLRPLLNLKKKTHVELFRTIALEVAYLVKKYKGSLSGEHGDGRLRGEFIPIIYGNKIYSFFIEIKKTFDPKNILNPGKIVNTPPMNTALRYKNTQKIPKIQTYFDFSNSKGYIRAIEKCNGTADCRKLTNGTMCPSFKATQNEENSTRARANTLRELISYGNEKNIWKHKEIYQILDMCLSCKACKNECPANVDITKIKAEFLQHYYSKNKPSMRTKIIANFSKLNAIMAIIPKFSSWTVNTNIAKYITAKIGFEPQREIPIVKKTLNRQYKKIKIKIKNNKIKTIYFFNDEFTNFNDPEIGLKTIILLNQLNYKVIILKNIESGRTYLSKGFVKKAKKIINKNIELLKNIISTKTPIIGIEPSTILTLRDENIDLATPKNINEAKKIAQNAFLFDEFIANEIEIGNIKKEKFTKKTKKILFHSHCYQKALSTSNATKKILNLPENYTAKEINTGCCGMAGAFGYEKEHYQLSMKVGEMKLFPAIRNTPENIEIVANGTSCRHHIKHATEITPKHPAEILYEAILK